MTILISSVALPMTLQMLGNLGHFLDLAQADVAERKYDESALTTARFAPDMVPLSRQITLSCESAIKGICRIANIDIPDIFSKPVTLVEMQAYVKSTMAFLQSVAPDKLDENQERVVEWEVRGKMRRMDTTSYMKHWYLPNFIFHVTVAYALLRHNGVQLGKFDYLLGPQNASDSE